MARRLADPAALRIAIDSRWMAVWGPDGLEERTALAEEILQQARETGDRELELPDEVLAILIGRGDDTVVPNGATVLRAGDRVLLLAPITAHAAMTTLLTRPPEVAP